MINEVLDLSRIETGHFELQFADFELFEHLLGTGGVVGKVDHSYVRRALIDGVLPRGEDIMETIKSFSSSIAPTLASKGYFVRKE